MPRGKSLSFGTRSSKEQVSGEGPARGKTGGADRSSGPRGAGRRLRSALYALLIFGAAVVLLACENPVGDTDPDDSAGGGETPATFTITYEANGATAGDVPTDNTEYESGEAATVLENTGGLERDGYRFTGWNTAADATGDSYQAGDTLTVEDASVTLYAEWVALGEYAVTYNANGADGGSAPSAQTKTEGTDLTLATNSGGLSKTGHTFVGWNTATDGSGTAYAEGAPYAGDADLVLYAEWAALIAYAVTYDPNGATSGTVPDDQMKFEGVSLALADNSGGLARDGVAFTGWNTAPDGMGTSYSVGGAYTADAALTLYAEWALGPAESISNGGFEAGDLSSWGSQIAAASASMTVGAWDGSNVRSGTYSLQAVNSNARAPNVYLSYGVNTVSGLKANTDYLVSFWAKGDATSPWTFTMRLDGLLGGWNNWVTSGEEVYDWTQFSGVVNTNAQSDANAIYLRLLTEDSGTVYVDDIEVREVLASP